QGRPQRLHALAAAEQQDLDSTVLDHRPQALGRDVGERVHWPALGSLREDQDRAIITGAADMEAVRAVAVDDLASIRDERRDIHRFTRRARARLPTLPRLPWPSRCAAAGCSRAAGLR